MAIPAPESSRPDRRRPRPPTLAPAAAAPRGLPLGIVLGLILSVVVALVLGTLTSLQQRREIRREQEARQRLLAEALVPLATPLAEAESFEVLQERLAWIEAAWRGRGHTDHGLVVLDPAGRAIAVAPSGGAVEAPPRALAAEIRFASPLLPNGEATLLAWQDAEDLPAEAASRWRLWWLDLLIASLAVIAVVQVAVHVLVGRPLGRLVRSLRHLELGYVGDLDSGPGAWEIRWLAWRFRHLGQELADQARRLVLAERRALEASGSLTASAPASRPTLALPPDQPTPDSRARDRETSLLRQYLEDSCRLLEGLRPGDLLAAELAEEAWNRSVVEAERLGDMRLKSRLDDTALRLLEPEAFLELERRLESLRVRRRSWERETRDRLAAVVAAAGAPCDGVQSRVKHTAGVWRKMTERQLELEQVHDLFAFRLLVPEEEHCYLALAAVHREFEAEPFRFKDYIAEPKANGYRSLHTTLRDDQGRVFEVQIRSREMHLEAEGGAAAHWRYRANRWTSFAVRRRQARLRRFLRRLLGR